MTFNNGNAQPPAPGWLYPLDDDPDYENEDMEYQARFTITTRQQANKLIEQIEARGIECRIQHLFDCDQVCIPVSYTHLTLPTILRV